MTTWLIDKSALVRLAASPDAAEWAARIERGLVRISTVTRLETGYSARSGPELRTAFQQSPLSSMPVEYLTPAIEDRAVEILTLLADRGQHRAPSIPDLIIAATAELAGLTVLHLDKDFDLIAEVTGQPMERLIEPLSPPRITMRARLRPDSCFGQRRRWPDYRRSPGGAGRTRTCLARQRPGIREIRITYGNGRFWNLKSPRFGRGPGP